MAQWNQIFTDGLYIPLPLPYSTCPPGKRNYARPRVDLRPLGGVCMTVPLPLTASLVPMPSARAIGVDLKGKCHSLSWPPTWHGICEGLWFFSGALQSSNGLTWCHLGSLFGWRGFFDLVSLQCEKVWQTPTKSVLVWSLQLILSQWRNGRKIMCQSVLLHVQLCVS